MSLKSTLVTLAIGLLLSLPATASTEVVGTGKITFLENGWFGEGIALRHSGPGMVGCSDLATDFAVDKNHPNYKEMVAMLLSAYSFSSDVELVVDKGTCLFGNRTKVIAIRLKK